MINVIGLGYIGLPTALMLAAHGQHVTGTDINPDIITRLRKGQLTFHEEGLDVLLRKAIQSGIQFSTETVRAEIYIVSVPTPYLPETHRVDAHFITDAVEGLLNDWPSGAILVIESTIPPGTIDAYVRPLIQRRGLVSGQDIHLAHAPERILPGNMLYELEENNRTIGADDPVVGKQIQSVYASFCKGSITLTDIRTAEMTKVVENTYRAVNIALSNELLKLCRSEGLDVQEILRICNQHPRVNLLQPGPGVGGHCIPIDPWFLVGDAPEETPLIREALRVNESMPSYVLSRLQQLMNEHQIPMDRVGLYGLTYKENVDDVRESPTLQLLDAIQRAGLPAPQVYDPLVSRSIVPQQHHDRSTFHDAVDLVVVLVGHDELRSSPAQFQDKIVLDTRGLNLPGAILL